MPRPQAVDSPWLTLGQASQLLGVHPTTLRAWVDAGRVHAYLTPGGHRRFQISELRAFLEQHRSDLQYRALIAPEQTLASVRRQLSSAPLSQHSWYARMPDERRSEHRETGRRLLGLLLQFAARHENGEELLAEARALASQYGREFAEARASTAELAQAFLTFRTMIVNAAYSPAGVGFGNDAEGLRLLRRINLFMDEMLIATLEAFESALRAGTAASHGAGTKGPAPRSDRSPSRE